MGLFDSWQKGVAAGKDQRRDRIMGEYGQKALGGDQAALAQVYGVDTGAGMQLQQYGAQQAATQRQAEQAQRQQGQEDAGRAALMFSQTRDPQYYAMWRQSLAGLPNAPQLPEALDPSEIDHAAQSAQAFAQAYGGFKGNEVPSAIRELQMLQQNPELAKLDMQRRQAGFGRPQLIQTADGYAWATPEGASPLNYGGQPGPQSGKPFSIDPSLPQNVQASIRNNEQAWAAAPDQSAVQLPPVATGPRVMPAPKASAKTELERRLELAQGMGASAEERKRLVLGNAAPRSSDALGGKALTQGTVNGLTKDAGKLDNLRELTSRFKSDFAGNTVTGGAENIAGRLGLPGATPGQADWWQQYDRYKNEVRNELFGASLTAGEQAAFEAADITPKMDPSRVKTNMVKQAEIIEKALRRKGRVWAAQGYNRAAIEEATGISMGDTKPQNPAAGGGLSAQEQAELDQLRAHFGRK